MVPAPQCCWCRKGTLCFSNKQLDSSFWIAGSTAVKWSGYVSTTSRAKISISLLKKKEDFPGEREGGSCLRERGCLFTQMWCFVYLSVPLTEQWEGDGEQSQLKSSELIIKVFLEGNGMGIGEGRAAPACTSQPVQKQIEAEGLQVATAGLMLGKN